jgi:SAM-dependent methyltransferase
MRSPIQRLFQDRRFVALYERVRESPFAWIAVGSTLESEMADLFASVGNARRVLDVACGQGTFSAGLARARPGTTVVGIDISRAQLARAEARQSGASFVRCDALETPLRGGAFEAVVFIGGLHQMADRARLAHEIARVTKPGARFAGGFLSGWRGASALRRGIEDAVGMWLVDPESWRRELEEAGFDPVQLKRRTPIWSTFVATRRR